MFAKLDNVKLPLPYKRTMRDNKNRHGVSRVKWERNIRQRNPNNEVEFLTNCIENMFANYCPTKLSQSLTKKYDIGYKKYDIGYKKYDIGYKKNDIGYKKYDIGYKKYDIGYKKYDIGYKEYGIDYKKYDIGYKKYDIGYKK